LPSVFFYISGHGFGHASRQIEIINAVGRLRPDLHIVVRTSAASWLFERTARVPLTMMAGDSDTGVVQIDSLRLDERATILRAAEFYRTLHDRARHEAQLLEQHDARLVVSDAPPLACAGAAKAGVPSVVVTNFTWDWIYEGYDGHLSVAPDLLPAIRNAYGKADAAWRLPMHGGFATFDTIVELPFVARHATHSRDDVRRTLRLPLDRPLVLSSFGGYGVNDLDVRRLDCLDEYGVVITRGANAPAFGSLPEGVHPVDEVVLYDSGLRYEDLVGACDVVATKPGYGIISECIANGTAMLYTSRGHFVEYDVLVADMPRYLRCAFIEQEELFAGRWQQALTKIADAPAAPEKPPTNGADVAAQLVAQRFARSVRL
jgi:hypothetical protein